MDIKDINIRNLQTENVRLRNLLADKDAIAKSIEHEKEEWTKEARVGYISLEEHFSDMEDFPISLQIFYSTENQRGFKKRGDSPTTIPQQFQLL